MEEAIKYWCDNNICVGMCYRGSRILPSDPISVYSIYSEDRLKITSMRPGKLIYQDGTVCSGSYAFADVYKLDSGSYQVYMDSARANLENFDGIESKIFSKLSKVVDYLASFGYDPTSCGDLITYLIGRIENEQINVSESQLLLNQKIAPILHKCDTNYELIKMIKDYGSRPYNKINER